MNIFLKNRLWLWVLIILVIINISALVSFFLFTGIEKAPDCCPTEGQKGHSFSNELGLSAVQTRQVDLINQDYKSKAEPLVLSIKEIRNAILSELEQKNPDTSLMSKLTGELALLQRSIQQENIRQYLELKKVCTPEQALKLSALYRDLYGCPRQAGTMQHQYRHGQDKGKSDSGRRCE